ncbi:hypothetical protein MMPV_007796 [Pyropia vietnamensis]
MAPPPPPWPPPWPAATAALVTVVLLFATTVWVAGRAGLLSRLFPATAAAAAAAAPPNPSCRRVNGPWLLRGATIATDQGSPAPPGAPCPAPGYAIIDVRLDVSGLITAVAAGGSLVPDPGEAVVDATHHLLTPGFVNAHTHSTEMLVRGTLPPLPRDLWASHLASAKAAAVAAATTAAAGGRGRLCPSSATDCLRLAATHAATELLLSGVTSVLDHVAVQSVAEAEAVMEAYREVGIRLFLAPMLSDESVPHENYVPIATAGRGVVEDGGGEGGHGGVTSLPPAAGPGLSPGGALRTDACPTDGDRTAAALGLWEALAATHHRPAAGTSIVIGPLTPCSCSAELLRGAAAIRARYGLGGHVQLLESRGQALESARRFGHLTPAGESGGGGGRRPSVVAMVGGEDDTRRSGGGASVRVPPGGTAVDFLSATGFLAVPGTVTSVAHAVWLTDADRAALAAAGAVVVHTPTSNLRLGSGVAGVRALAAAGVGVALGVDGGASNGGQDFTETIKLTTLLSTLVTPDYRQWVSPRQALAMATVGGAAAVGLAPRGGVVACGAVADVCLWDLTALCMLPRGDPLSSLVLGRPQGGGAGGAALSAVWVRGRRLVAGGVPLTVDVPRLRRQLWTAFPAQRSAEAPAAAAAAAAAAAKTTAAGSEDVPPPAFHLAAENEYRAALALDEPEDRRAELAASQHRAFSQVWAQ